jgi:hypothetical protein
MKLLKWLVDFEYLNIILFRLRVTQLIEESTSVRQIMQRFVFFKMELYKIVLIPFNSNHYIPIMI